MRTTHKAECSVCKIAIEELAVLIKIKDKFVVLCKTHSPISFPKTLDRHLTIKPTLEYVEANCYKWTFDAKKVKRFVMKNCRGKILNLFAGKNRLSIHETRVDSSNEFSPDYHMKAEKFIKKAQQKNWKYDTIIYDPPWNERKSKEFYNGHYIGKFTKLKDDIVSLLTNTGIIISAGYTITNFGESRGLELEKILNVNPKGEIRPYFISIEQKQPSLDSFIHQTKNRRKTDGI
ncbi:hypothetical protein CEE45_01725 [Candidatus Heimdallarchaeota archaeon B3_Heim]|nr:MAG: hypothetical protein CEE45_01725 [Candidatus Heimdallarchaeota archaeon B3_Heim]